MPRPGSTTARGYGWKDHQTERARWTPIVQLGKTPCRRCGHLIPRTPPGHRCTRGCQARWCWDLGHDDADRTKPKRPEHRHRNALCIGNRAAGATIGKALAAGRRLTPRRRPPTADRW